MIPTSVSASALETASQCLARYKATAIQKGAGINNPAAMLGSTLHAALEKFVDPLMIKAGVWDWDFLLTLYTHAFQDIFGSDEETRWFDDGKQILWNWFNRKDIQDDLREAEILSREVKENFPVPYKYEGNKYEVPLNYIMDRFDQLGPNEYRVVDYKSQRLPLKPDELRRKIQAKVYALACQIKYPNAEKIWVQFDFLRYDRVAVLFTRDDNITTWRSIKRAVQRIVDTPENDPLHPVPETLNENCRYCPRKYTCQTLQRNLRIGGVMGLEVDQLALIYHDLKSQLDGLKQMTDEVEGMLIKHAVENDILEWDGDLTSVTIKARTRRKINREKISEILGPQIMAEYGRINVSDLPDLRNDRRLTPTQRSLLETAVEHEPYEPQVRVTRREP
jgi:hypothetical protein